MMNDTFKSMTVNEIDLVLAKQQLKDTKRLCGPKSEEVAICIKKIETIEARIKDDVWRQQVQHTPTKEPNDE